jgi:hypothetical protein
MHSCTLVSYTTIAQLKLYSVYLSFRHCNSRAFNQPSAQRKMKIENLKQGNGSY